MTSRAESDGRGDARGTTHERRLVRIVSALLGLVSLLVVGLAFGGVLAWREYAAMRDALRATRGDVSGAEYARATAEQATQRQQALALHLASAAKEHAREIAAYERRAEKLRKLPGGPVDNAQHMMEVGVLMMEESTFALRQTAALLEATAEAVRPLPVQRPLLEQGARAARAGR